MCNYSFGYYRFYILWYDSRSERKKSGDENILEVLYDWGVNILCDSDLTFSCVWILHSINQLLSFSYSSVYSNVLNNK